MGVGRNGVIAALDVGTTKISCFMSLAGQLLLYDALDATFRKIRLPRDASCQLCGDRPSITDLSAHEVAAKEPA